MSKPSPTREAVIMALYQSLLPETHARIEMQFDLTAGWVARVGTYMSTSAKGGALARTPEEAYNSLAVVLLGQVSQRLEACTKAIDLYSNWWSQ